MAARTYFVCSFLAFAAAILWSYQPPLFMDYPDWVYQGVLFGKMLAGHPAPGYALKPYPVPNTVSTVGIGLLSIVFGWALAAKLWIVFYLSIACATCLYLGKLLRLREHAIWWILPGVLFFSRGFWLGTINFDLGLCSFLLLAGILCRGTARSWLVVGLLLLTFFTHFVAYAAALLVVLLYCLQTRNWKPLRLAAATVPLAAWYAAGRAAARGNETALGSSLPSHLAPMFMVVAACVFIGIFRQRRSILRMVVPSLFGLSALTVFGAAVTLLWSPSHRTAHLQDAAILVQDKLFAPLGFGFVNLTDTSSIPKDLSTGAKRSEQLFTAGFICVTLTGLLLVIAGIEALRKVRTTTDSDSTEVEFLWEFSALMTLLYLLCPPNALGVVGIDLRLAELALGIMLFLLARNASLWLRLSAAPVVLFTLANLYQFSLWQTGVPLPDTLSSLPPSLNRCCKINPLIRMEQYNHLRVDKLDDPIFPTGIIIDKAHHESPPN